MRVCVRYSFLLAILFFSFLGCQKNINPVLFSENDTTIVADSIIAIEYQYIDPSLLTFNYVDSIEAQFISIWWTDSLRPIPDTTSKFLYDIGAIRYLFQDSSFNLNDCRFDTWGDYSKINIKFDSIHTEMIYDSTYLEWNVFDADLRPIKITDRQFLSSVTFTFEFRGVLNPSGLVSIYKNLPGVTSCYREISGYTELNLEPLYPFRNDSASTYLFVPSIDLKGSMYYYFSVMGSRIGLIGSWNQQEKSEIPIWWEDAQQNMDYFYDKQ
jgi:hypothetical protein